MLAVPPPSTWCCICLDLFCVFQFSNILCELFQIDASSLLCTFCNALNTVASDLPAIRLRVNNLHYEKKLMICKAKKQTHTNTKQGKKNPPQGRRTFSNTAYMNAVLFYTEFLSRSWVHLSFHFWYAVGLKNTSIWASGELWRKCFFNMWQERALYMA